jgi:hypothetical protein
MAPALKNNLGFTVFILTNNWWILKNFYFNCSVGVNRAVVTISLSIYPEVLGWYLQIFFYPQVL